MAIQNLLLLMRNNLLGNVCCCEVVKSFSRLESNSLTILQLVKAFKTLTGVNSKLDVVDEKEFTQ